MHDILWIEILKIIGALVGFGSGAFFTFWRVRQKKLASEMGLADNPERCGRHQEAIDTIKVRLDKIEDKLDEVARELRK